MKELEIRALELVQEGLDPWQVNIALAKEYGSKALVEYLELDKLLSQEADLEKPTSLSESDSWDER